MRKEAGQVILILILVMTVALAIGISVVQRSLSDISTSSKVEQSGRAFSAAEAGIEKAIQSDSNITTSVDLGNNSVIQGVEKNDVPAANQALEYPPIGKEEMAQVWLVKPSDLITDAYSGNIDLYWGNANRGDSEPDLPAIELIVVYLSTDSSYKAKKFFFDSSAASRNNGFDSSVQMNPSPLDTSMGNSRSFKLKKTVDIGLTSIPDRQRNILLRVRLLYTSVSDAFAVKPVSGSLPKQASVFTSVGTAGDTQRRIQVFRLNNVVPFYFDYAIFSASDITK